MRSLCIFEDGGFRNLLPLVYTRPVYELRCGIDLLLDKIIRFYPEAHAALFCREYLRETLLERLDFPVNTLNASSGCLFINGRILMSEAIPLKGEEEIGIGGGRVIYARLDKENSVCITPAICLEDSLIDFLKALDVKRVPCDAQIIKYPWDLVNHNADQIREDFKVLAPTGCIEGTVYEGAYLLNDPQICIGRGSKIKPGTVLDAEDGPIYIGEDVTVYPNSVIEGPAYIGDGSKIKTGAKIYEGTSIGEVCKVGGEVEETIIYSYSNKQHDGFLGHSYVGMWCNIGAGTSNSDLKNNYGNVKVQLGHESLDSGLMFVGMIMGDHSKSGINTMFNTGTVVGMATNIFGTGFPPKFIPSFTWGGASGLVTYNLEKALEVARRVMGRRDRELSSAQENLMRAVFEQTKFERDSLPD